MDEWGMSHELLNIACKPMKDLTRDDIRALKEEYQRLYGRPSPARPSRTFLTGNVAWGLQAEAQGDNPLALRQKLVAQFATQSIKKRTLLSNGAQLVREWKGNTYIVTKTKEGYRYQNKTYKSLTPIAKHITNNHISGPKFFGLTKSVHEKTSN